MKSIAQTVIEADRFYTIAAKTGSVISLLLRRHTSEHCYEWSKESQYGWMMEKWSSYG